jgi:PAT family beta-lactamase induction signal transducer AmpG
LENAPAGFNSIRRSKPRRVSRQLIFNLPANFFNRSSIRFYSNSLRPFFTKPLAAAKALLLNSRVVPSDFSKRFPRNPWKWIPTLYLAEGMPNVVVAAISVVLYKELGVSNAEIGFYTSWLYLPWALKPQWSPVVDLLKTRRLWIWTMQLLVGCGFAGVALTIPTPHFFQCTLAFFYLLAFSSATHDIAADGFYMLALDEGEQSFFVGVRNTFYRAATIIGQGGLLILVGQIQKHTGSVTTAWSSVFFGVAVLFAFFAIYHRVILPKPANDRAAQAGSLENFFHEFVVTFAAFFQKPNIVRLLLFLLFYRFGEAHLVKMVSPFLLDPREAGGLHLSVDQLGVIYGTVGLIALLCGGLAGGFLASRQGLKFWLWPMALAIHLPDAVFIYLAYAQPHNLVVIGSCVAVEQFGYGFGFTAYMLYMIYIARGEHRTAHYAICTGFMALGLMLPGMWSGWLQEHLGYQHFFLWVMLATIPGFIVTALIPLDAQFGKKRVGQ